MQTMRLNIPVHIVRLRIVRHGSRAAEDLAYSVASARFCVTEVPQ